MTNSKEKTVKTIQNYSNMYKVISTISMIGIVKNEFDVVKRNYKTLTRLYERIKCYIKTVFSESVYEKIENGDFAGLPEELSPLVIVDTYNKILALKYTDIETESVADMIAVNKMSIELNPDEEIPYIRLANIFYENEKYPEVIEMCKIMKEISNTAPMWEILGKTYRKLGRYGEAVEAYRKYLKLNENDNDAQEHLNEIYEEALK